MKMVVLLPIKVHPFTFTKISPFLCLKSLSPLRRKAGKKARVVSLESVPICLEAQQKRYHKCQLLLYTEIWFTEFHFSGREIIHSQIKTQC